MTTGSVLSVYLEVETSLVRGRGRGVLGKPSDEKHPEFSGIFPTLVGAILSACSVKPKPAIVSDECGTSSGPQCSPCSGPAPPCMAYNTFYQAKNIPWTTEVQPNIAACQASCAAHSSCGYWSWVTHGKNGTQSFLLSNFSRLFEVFFTIGGTRITGGACFLKREKGTVKGNLSTFISVSGNKYCNVKV